MHPRTRDLSVHFFNAHLVANLLRIIRLNWNIILRTGIFGDGWICHQILVLNRNPLLFPSLLQRLVVQHLQPFSLLRRIRVMLTLLLGLLHAGWDCLPNPLSLLNLNSLRRGLDVLLRRLYILGYSLAQTHTSCRRICLLLNLLLLGLLEEVGCYVGSNSLIRRLHLFLLLLRPLLRIALLLVESHAESFV